MNLLSAQNIHKAYTDRMLLQGVDFSIEQEDRIGLIGTNGTGKSTLLKMIAHVEAADQGTWIRKNGLRIEYLAQNPPYDPQKTVIEHIFSGASPLMALLRSYEQALFQLERAPGDEKAQRALTSLAGMMDAQNAWNAQSEAKRILQQLRIFDLAAWMGQLSGGQRKRVEIAGTMIRPCDLWILDEPTNHIDSDTVEFLEAEIQSRRQALLMVTHDRYFLDRAATRIWEIDQGALYSYSGGYSAFVEQKAAREAQESRLQEKRQSLYKAELQWMRKGVEARRTKQKARQERFYDLAQSVQEDPQESLEMSSAATRLGKKIVYAQGVYKSYPGLSLMEDLSLTLLRGDRIGILGPNGTGKSTLLALLAGHMQPDRGVIERGETVKIGFYAQESPQMPQEMRVIDYIREFGESIKTASGETISASQMLERFLFAGALQYQKVERLSGGERRRLYLLSVLIQSPNLLLLDEPTNDLDTNTLTVLEAYLQDFPGPVVAVSHDRYFLDKLANRLLVFEGEGKILQVPGNYSDYRERQREWVLSKPPEASSKTGTPALPKRPSSTPKQPQKLRFTYNEQKEYDTIETIISQVEGELSKVGQQMECSSSDFPRLHQLMEEQQALQSKLEELFARWEYLTEKAEQIESQNS